MAMTMRERIARAICEADGYGADPDPETARDWERHKSIGWPYPCKAGWLRYQDHADAVLSELETPTLGMLTAALVARYPDWGTSQYADSDDARVIDGMRLALAASAKAAREGK